MKNIPETHGIN